MLIRSCNKPQIIPFSWAALLLLAGCGRDPISVYQAPKEASRTASPSADHDPTHAASQTETLEWKLPQGWEQQPTSGMRTAAFTVKSPQGQEVEIAIMPFKRMGGSDLQFVNLWRQTLGLQPVDQSRLDSMVQSVPIGPEEGKYFDVMEDPPDGESALTNRIVVALLVRGDTSWFFKLAGDTTLVSDQTENFKAFLKSISFKSSGAAAAAKPEPATAVPASGSPTLPQWEVPASWKTLPPSSMLLAKFQAQGQDNAQVEITVSAFPGDVGGLLANVNRWRSQIGLSPVTAGELDSVVSNLSLDAGEATLVDLSGPGQPEDKSLRLLGAILPRDGRTWFFKLLGDAAVAEQEKEAFLKFLQSARYPNG